jgi:phytoene/squalene synthetase
MSLIPSTRGSVDRSYDAVARLSAAVVIRNYSTSFGMASRLLAEPVRTHVRNVYALVRIADEIVDSTELGLDVFARGAALDRLQDDTHAALRSRHSSNLVVHAFAVTADAVGIEVDIVDPFFAAMRTDLHATEHDAASLERYIYGSAEVVGLMCLRAFLAGEPGAPTYEELAPGARHLGAAFQKINFLRDLAEDHRLLGRSYFPGVSPETLSEQRRDEILDDIDADLAIAATAVPRLPASSRRAVAAAYSLFEDLALRLRATPPERILAERVRVPNAVKARLVSRTLLRRSW